MSVPHTWGLHPHVHMVVPSGGLSPDGSRWIACRNRYFRRWKFIARARKLLALRLKESNIAEPDEPSVPPRLCPCCRGRMFPAPEYIIG
jgi:hypothetical protein